uniref:Si:ch211-269k10.5 n=1 Tax=Paramormyrops kingsleyae TaxID=1676925 RepID=A0A3B3Q5G6_9TELE
MDTFKCDECIVITIPLVKGDRGQSETLTPEKFHCVFKDSYKVFRKGQPKVLGIAQIVTGLLVITLGLVHMYKIPGILTYTMPSLLFVASGIVSYGAGHSPNMCVTGKGINVIIAIQLSLEMLVATVLIYWESKAVCRTDFNTLPLINLKYV